MIPYGIQDAPDQDPWAVKALAAAGHSVHWVTWRNAHRNGTRPHWHLLPPEYGDSPAQREQTLSQGVPFGGGPPFFLFWWGHTLLQPLTSFNYGRTSACAFLLAFDNVFYYH